MPLHLEIVTPEKKVFSDTVANVYLPGADGELGILPAHGALVTALAPGELRYEKDGVVTALAIGNGFAEVTLEKVNILTDMALGDDQIDAAAAEEAIQRAEKQLLSIDHAAEIEEVAHLRLQIAKSLAQLKIKRRHH
ncbi:MAG: ATP synthase F1 subunit epsilon [Verrucomicrobia bacterium]|jgi:F-type H+-transporting ATPase subunit epsilon|nr:MAG: ATP synthase F1 subunit epsilon [Verrucomicrobiota bacterium]